MESAFDTFRKLGPAAFVVKAIVSVIVAVVLLLGFILLRRTYRKWYFANRDARRFAIRQKWDALISGKIPCTAWRTKASERQLIEDMVLDAFEIANSEESVRLLKFMRASGLVEKRISEARHHKGWRRHRALVALARTRAPEGIPALSEGLRDRDSETRLAALRGRGRGQVATPSIGPYLLQFADDKLPELRAAAARGLGYLNPRAVVDVLGGLAKDSVWFVRLRAIVSLGEGRHPEAIPSLLRGLTDSNRLVR